MPFLTPFFGWEGSPTQIDFRKKGTLILPTEDPEMGGIPAVSLERPKSEAFSRSARGAQPSISLEGRS